MDGTATAVRGPQHMRALERANEVRLARADLKRRIADGQLRAADVILEAPWEAESMAVADVLMSQRRWGRTRARRLLAGIQMSETKTLGSMTDRQRRAVALAVADATPDGGAPPAGAPDTRGPQVGGPQLGASQVGEPQVREPRVGNADAAGSASPVVRERELVSA
jgi:hypothetical protein